MLIGDPWTIYWTHFLVLGLAELCVLSFFGFTLYYIFIAGHLSIFSFLNFFCCSHLTDIIQICSRIVTTEFFVVFGMLNCLCEHGDLSFMICVWSTYFLFVTFVD